MERALRYLRGGILGLLALPRETWEAIEADLFQLGRTVADIPQTVSWRVLKSMLTYARRGSAVFAQLNGAAGWWDHSDYLLAAIHDQLAAANWQRSGGQGDYPTPYPRPGDRAPGQAVPLKEGEQHFGSGAVTIDEFNDFWNEGVPA